ncbi:Fur family transcriptional regulator [Mobilitalea sibirica]|uniref:Manganese transport regulator n=1 Tax=Mobilitalea sibirica TaxID=1462919 RepID=A0A8J7H3N2_9FIRM|nr:iron dependent repressor, metal binding and dimerization domain protein [Mobilitalea sibirica]MBH1941788.1 Fur family transcriptional regulator [Mobilitalea sibirica]
MANNEFYTFREFMRKDQDILSPSAEDYIEMIYRLSEKYGFTRVHDLAAALNVQPPSVTKMIQKLADMNLIKYERYGVIMLEPSGVITGKALLMRHNLVEKFLEFLNITDGLLEETEKIEHTMNEEILCGIKDLLDFFQQYPGLWEDFMEFRNHRMEQ